MSDQFKRKTMCNECPFRANSLKGWLGPLTVEQLEGATTTDEVFICHKSINSLSKKGKSSEEIELTGQHCIGILRYRNSMCKLNRNKKICDVQMELKNIPDQEVIPRGKLREHHKGTPSLSEQEDDEDDLFFENYEDFEDDFED